MDNAIAAFLIKLPLAILVFVVVAYAGTTNRRIAGVLFTFPILNGIAIIASDQPIVVAEAVYPLVIFNCVLFAALISFPRMLPPVGRLSRSARFCARIALWALVWLAGAFVITSLRAEISGGGILLVGAAIVALAFMLATWSGQPTITDTPPSGHIARFIAFWNTVAGGWRIAFFVLTYAVLFFAARAAQDQKWVGMASALPLPGLFALASLVDDAEERAAPLATLRAIRDTLFLGPLLVIPFNWIFSHALVAMPPDAIVQRYALLFAMWTIAALAVLVAVPRLAAWFDARARPR